MGFFGAVHRWGGAKKVPLPEICHTCPTMMKLGTVIPYLKKIQNIYKSRDTTLELFWHQHFFTRNCHIKKYRYRLHFDKQFLILLSFLESLKIVLINVIKILMMSAKLVTTGILKVKVFWNKSYDVITSFHDVTNKFYPMIQMIL